MAKFLTFGNEKRGYENALLSNLSSKQALFSQLSEYLITKSLKSPHDWDNLLNWLKRLPMTPHTVIKALMLVHTFLQTGKAFAENKVVAFINYIIFQCSNFAENSSNVKTADQSQSGKAAKGRMLHTDTSTREDESFDCKEGLMFNIAKIYIRYLLKVVAIYEDYRRLSKLKEVESHFVWVMINLLKTISGFAGSFTTIGRYFFREYGVLSISLIEVITRDVRKLVDCIRSYVTLQNHLLSCETNSGQEVGEFMKMMDEINELNETLIQIYLGKYYFDELQHIEKPKWINTNSNEFDSLFKLAGKRKEGKKKQPGVGSAKVCRTAFEEM